MYATYELNFRNPLRGRRRCIQNTSMAAAAIAMTAVALQPVAISRRGALNCFMADARHHAPEESLRRIDGSELTS